MRISDWSSDVCSSELLVYQEQGRNAEALERFREAVKLAPREIPLQFSLAKSLWRNGRFEESWNYFDAGLIANLRKPNRRFRQPRWQGEDIPAKRNLVWREQGVGGDLDFSRGCPTLLYAAWHGKRYSS